MQVKNAYTIFLSMTTNRSPVILVVDDTPANLLLLTQLLSAQSYDVRPVTQGTAALTAIRTIRPDLVLLDIRMPDMDGYEVCQQLKADEETAQIPVIFISALDDVEDKVRAFECGGVDYIAKPFQPLEVLARVRTTWRWPRRAKLSKLPIANSNEHWPVKLSWPGWIG